jgi:hypothetical protein
MVSPFVKPGDSVNERVALQSAEYAVFKAALDLTSKVGFLKRDQGQLCEVMHHATWRPCLACLVQCITSVNAYTKPPNRPAELAALEGRDRSTLSTYQIDVSVLKNTWDRIPSPSPLIVQLHSFV